MSKPKSKKKMGWVEVDSTEEPKRSERVESPTPSLLDEGVKSDETNKEVTAIQTEIPKVEVDFFFICYFAYKFDSDDKVVLNMKDGQMVPLSISEDSHIVWVKHSVPERTKICFRVQVLFTKQSKQWEGEEMEYTPSYYQYPYCMVNLEDVFYNATSWAVVKIFGKSQVRYLQDNPYLDIAAFLSGLSINPKEFQHVIKEMFPILMKHFPYDWKYIKFSSLLSHINDQRSDRFLLALLFIDTYNQGDRNVNMDKRISVDMLLSSHLEFINYPEYIPLLLKEKSLHNGDRSLEGLIYITISMLYSTQSREQETRKFAEKFKSICAGTFTESEREFLLKFEWNRALRPHMLCANMKMARSIEKLREVKDEILKRSNINNYILHIKSLDLSEYLEEWKTFLEYSVEVSADDIPFSFAHAALYHDKKKLDKVTSMLIFAENSNTNPTWLNHLAKEACKILKDQPIGEKLGVLSKLSSAMLIQKIHGDIPSDREDIPPRLKRICDPHFKNEILIGLEVDSIMDYFQQRSYESGDILNLLETKGYSKHPRVSKIYELVLFNEIQRLDTGGDMLKKKAILDIIESDRSNLPSFLLVKDFNLQFTKTRDNKSKFNGAYNKLIDDALKLVAKLETGSLLMAQFNILKSEQVLSALGQLLPGFDSKVVKKLENKLNEDKKLWSILLESLNVMNTRKQFSELAKSLITRYSDQYESLEMKNLCEWNPPVTHSLFLEISQHYDILKNSTLFKYTWSNQEIGAHIHPKEDNLLNLWIEYMQVYRENWNQLVVKFLDGSLPISTVATLIKKFVFRIDYMNRLRNSNSSEAEVRQHIERIRQESRDAIAEIIENEMKCAYHFLGAKQFAKSTVEYMYFDCCDAVNSSTDMIALKHIFEELSIPKSSSIIKFCELFEENTDPNVIDVIGRYREIEDIAKMKDIIKFYPDLFLNVFYKGDLMKILRSYSIATLDQRLDNRQCEDIRAETHDVLNALRLVGNSIMSHRYFVLIKDKSPITYSQLVDFLIQTGSAVIALIVLKNTRESIVDALHTETEEKQTIAIVKNLLVNGGAFIVEVKNGKSIVYAKQNYKSNNEKESTIISPEELEALPSQLLLTSGVTTKNNVDDSNIDDPLPENISKLEDRERYVLRFNKIYDTSYELAKITQKLNNSGHPNFQKNELIIDCRVKISELVSKLKQQEETLTLWIATFDSFRSRNPILSFLSRSQLVSCISSLRSKDTSGLFTTLQSVGCNPSKMQGSLDSLVSDVNTDKASILFELLNRCLVNYFDFDRLNDAVVNIDRNTFFDGLTCKLLRIASGKTEEFVCGAHISIHNRVPTSIEILFCNSQTSDFDIEDFLDRWNMFKSTNDLVKRENVTFWLVNVEQLSYPTQTRLVQKFNQLLLLAKDLPRLLLVTSGLSTSYVSSIMFKEVELISSDQYQNFTKLISIVAEKNNQIKVVHSNACSMGKTESVIRDLVCEKFDHMNNPILHTQLSIDTTPMDIVFTKLSCARPFSSDKGIILHFVIGHQGDPDEINQLLTQYLLVGTWRDKQGNTYPRHEKDTVVIELCNTGLNDERERITICKYFQQIPLRGGISWRSLLPIKQSELIYSFKYDDHAHLGTRMLVAFFNAKANGTTHMGNVNSIANVPIPGEQELMDIVLSLVHENSCQKNHFMKCSKSFETTCSNCSKKIENGTLKSTCNGCKYHLCSMCMKRMNIHPKSELSYLRRYFKFATSQLEKFYYSFHSQWELETISDEGFIYGKMPYHYASIIHLSVKNLSIPAVLPLDAEKNPDEDDVSRCKNMDKFEKWRETPFVVCTPGNYTIVSTSSFSPLELVKRQEKDAIFREYISLVEVALKPKNRESMHSMCTELNESPFNLDQSKPPLRDLLDIIGCSGGPYPLLEAISSIKERNLKERKLAEFKEDYPFRGAIEYLNKMNAFDPEENITCSNFVLTCSNYLRKLFGANPDKPQYTITADNILRLIAVQMRLSSSVPVCIMGETGCGKTEAIGFLSNISAMEFDVVNVQEGMSEQILYNLLLPTIQKAEENKEKQFVVLMDEVNATYALWTAKDLLTDRIISGVRIPRNISFIVILNPWKVRSSKQEKAIAEMDVGGLDFLKYQQSSSSSTTSQTKYSKKLSLVYQVHKIPETLYSLVWDWGSASTTKSPIEELSKVLNNQIHIKTRNEVSDELILATNMVSWLIKKLSNDTALLNTFKRAGDGTGGLATWIQFRTIVVELLLASQDFIRHDVYLDELSSVSIRDIRKACELVWLVYHQFLRKRGMLNKEFVSNEFSEFDSLTSAVHIALISTYCLRLDSHRRFIYLTRIHSVWNQVRSTITMLHRSFLPAPAVNPTSYESSDLYKSFNDLAIYIIQDLDVDNGIAVNQALKENVFAVLCAVCTKSALFIVGRPGSTKSRTLELLCRATENLSNKKNSFLSSLGISIQKHVIQCSPYTTAHHVHINARNAARAQISADNLQNTTKRINVIVLEEVGATIGSQHNPLMSLHSMIDYGIEIDGKKIRLPIIGVSNYRLDASKMGRGRVVYRGNPPISDLEATAKAILSVFDASIEGTDWISGYAHAFSENILNNEEFTWYHGMRDFYATVSTMRVIANPIQNILDDHNVLLLPEINSHIARWAILINFRGFPNKEKENFLSDTMLKSFRLDENTLAKWEWKMDLKDTDSIKLCDSCCKMQLYLISLAWQVDNPDDEINDTVLRKLFKERATPVHHRSFCEYFKKFDHTPAPEIISYSLREHASRHVMIFTKANAALSLLFSMKLVNKDRCTVIFQTSSSKDQSTSTSELVQQMMRIKACMKEGKTLILVKSRHLYESLLDALNVHYTKDKSFGGEDDNLHRTVLSMAGVTQSVFVKPSFRCIVLEDQDELSSCVLPPMINRFSKVVMTYESALNPHQRAIRNQINSKCIVSVGDDQLNILEFLIPGLSDETINSAICSFDSLDDVLSGLCFCFSRKNLRRLEFNLVEGLDSSETRIIATNWIQEWKEYGCDQSFESLCNDVLEDTNHLMILTEQMQLDSKSILSTFESIFMKKDETSSVIVNQSFFFLNQASSQDVHTALIQLKRTPTNNSTSAFTVFVLDTTAATQSILLDSFMYTVSTENLGEKQHVVLIVVVSDLVNEKKHPFSFVFDNSWGQLYADEIIPKKVLYNQKESLISELESYEFLHDTLNPNLVCALIVEKSNLTKLCQSISTTEEVKSNLNLIEKLFLSQSPLCTTIIKYILELIYKESITLERWSKKAFQKSKFSSDSLCSIYIDFLGSFVVHLLKNIFTLITCFGSLEIALNDHLNEFILSNLIDDDMIVTPPNVVECLELKEFNLVKKPEVSSRNGFFRFSSSCKVRFPLSPFIITQLFDLGPDKNRIENYVRSHNLEKMEPKAVQNYIMDAIILGLDINEEKFLLFTAVATIFHKDITSSISKFHEIISTNFEWFSSVIKFCTEDFDRKDLHAFIQNQETNDPHAILKLASVGGIIPLKRVDILSSIIKDSTINWNIVRAISIIDTIPNRSNVTIKEDKIRLSKLYDLLLNDISDGISFMFTSCPSYYTKYILFEVFSSNVEVDVLRLILANLSNIIDLEEKIKNEDFLCGIAFLLRNTVKLFFQHSDMFSEELESICSLGLPLYTLTLHCIFDILFEEIYINEELVKRLQNDSQIHYVVRMVMIVCILHIQCQNESDEFSDCLNILLKSVGEEDVEEIVLYVIRNLSNGGTVDIENAVKIAKQKFPFVSGTSSMAKVETSFQKKLPVSYIEGFTNSFGMIRRYGEKDVTVDSFKNNPHKGRVASVVTYCIAQDTSIPFNDKVFEFFGRSFEMSTYRMLETLRTIRKEFSDISSTDMVYLVAHTFASIMNKNEIMVLFKDMSVKSAQMINQIQRIREQIDELLVPRCPRCKVAFFDWTGCFSVYCDCGCSFCGFCLLDCGQDAHEHVQKVHGTYYGVHDDFLKSFGKLATPKIIEFMKTVSPDIKPHIENILPSILENNSYYIRPEHIIQNNQVNNANAPDVSPIISIIAELLSLCGDLWYSTMEKNNSKSTKETLSNIEKLVKKANNILFPHQNTDSSIFNWLHAFISQLNDTDQKVNSKQEILTIIQNINGKFASPVDLLQHFSKKFENYGNETLEKLTINQEKLFHNSPNNTSTRRTLICIPRSIYKFKHQFWAHVETNYETYPIMNLLRENRYLLDKRRTLIDSSLGVLNFLGNIESLAKKESISKTFVEEEGSFYKFVSEHESLKENIDKFQVNFRRIFQHISNWECKDIDNLYQHFKNQKELPDDTKLECFLPQREGNGILAKSLWNGYGEKWSSIPYVQNKIYCSIHHNGEKPSSIRYTSPYTLSNSDIVTVDYQSLVSLIRSLFVLPGYYPRLSTDLNVLESLCKYGSLNLASYPYLCPELPDHAYALHGILDIFMNLEQMHHIIYAPLPVSFGISVSKLIEQSPHACDPIVSFCYAIVLQETQRRGAPPNMVSQIHVRIPLTEEQELGKRIIFEIPGASSSFCIQHIPALIGLCMKKKKNFIHESARIEITDNYEIERMKKFFHSLVEDEEGKVSTYHNQIPNFLANLRATGVAHFSSEINEATANGSLCIYFEAPIIEVKFVNDIENMENIPPFSTLAKHFGHVLQLAESILSPHEYSSHTEDDRSTIVSFSAVRPFLKTIDSTTTKTKESKSKEPESIYAPEVQLHEQNARPVEMEEDPQNLVVWTSSFGDLDLNPPSL
eukprot:TRINITY_DN343_c0_g3_i1.p1 TRINITY_DN343_c0_g3~~TRINITY_DN343_c0_g3_i1.p1  ORF type:complete len:4704 (-),score=480.58 TRINITY_DN343_c0_g3_i1:101-14212(-)